MNLFNKCKHENFEETWEYTNDFKYTELLNDVCTTRYKKKKCIKCGKTFDTINAEATFISNVKNEAIENFISNSSKFNCLNDFINYHINIDYLLSFDSTFNLISFTKYLRENNINDIIDNENPKYVIFLKKGRIIFEDEKYWKKVIISLKKDSNISLNDLLLLLEKFIKNNK